MIGDFGLLMGNIPYPRRKAPSPYLPLREEKGVKRKI
jgi:hypothetical protein